MVGKTRAERKVAAALRAKQALDNAWARIDYAEDTIKPAVLAIRAYETEHEVELTEDDLVALLTTGKLPVPEIGP